jgi:hypothetical protein
VLFHIYSVGYSSSFHLAVQAWIAFFFICIDDAAKAVGSKNRSNTRYGTHQTVDAQAMLSRTMP